MKSNKGFGMKKNDFANMPQKEEIRHYPKGKSLDRHLDDSMNRLDQDSDYNHKKIKSHQPKSMW